MKKFIMILMFCATSLYAQTPPSSRTLQVITDNGVQTYLGCHVEVQSHSDTVPIQEYWLTDCPDSPPPIILGPAVGQSIIAIDGVTTFVCPMETSIFGTGDAFYMIMDCRDLLPEVGHLWVAIDGEILFYPNCELWKSRHSDDSGYSQYWLTCPESPPTAIIQPLEGYRNTDVWVNGSFTLSCPMAESDFGRDNTFYMLMVCNTSTIFKNGFEQ